MGLFCKANIFTELPYFKLSAHSVKGADIQRILWSNTFAKTNFSFQALLYKSFISISIHDPIREYH